MGKIIRNKNTVEFGDFQTPMALTNDICKVLSDLGIDPQTIIEPTCGEGSFLLSAVSTFPAFKKAIGLDINPYYVEKARAQLKEIAHADQVSLEEGNFFTFNWQTLLNALPSPFLIIGNPPWVTTSTLGAIGSTNLPHKSNFQNYKGFSGITGKSNFDISERMLLKMLNWLNGKYGTLAMLWKTSVARKVLTRMEK